MRLDNDNVTAVNDSGCARGPLDEGPVQWTEDLLDNCLLPNKLAALGASSNRSPDDVIVAGVPERSAIALGQFIENV